MKKIFNLVLTGTILSLVLITPKIVFADEVCTPIYGGGETCVTSGHISINKSVQNPQNGIFVDNLTTNDPKFTPGQIINFKIVVTNTSDANISTVTVNDIFPNYLTYVSGNGSFNSGENTLTFNLNNLNGGKSQTFNVQAKVVDGANIPFANGVVCVVNQAFGRTSDGQTSQDNSQLCISKTTVIKTKGGLPVMPAPKIITTPPTGPEMLPLLALIPTGIAGFILRRKVNK
jgi:uncharacterized repeat protein (TIGR01451 family)